MRRRCPFKLHFKSLSPSSGRTMSLHHSEFHPQMNQDPAGINKDPLIWILEHYISIAVKLSFQELDPL